MIVMAPTVLRILGISPGNGMEGRVLEEALANGPEAGAVEWSTELHNTERRIGYKVYRQQIQISRVGETTYIDHGNSTFGWRYEDAEYETHPPMTTRIAPASGSVPPFGALGYPSPPGWRSSLPRGWRRHLLRS